MSIAGPAAAQNDPETTARDLPSPDAVDEDPPRCIDGRPNPANEFTRAALEEGGLFIASLAPPDYRLFVRAFIHSRKLLPGQGSHETREAKNGRASRDVLAARRDAALIRLTEMGAEVIRAQKPSSMLDFTLPARHAPQAFCLPEIQWFSVQTRYWDLVEPSWDVDQVGTMECPVIEGSCPDHCSPAMGSRFDENRGCFRQPRERMACIKRGPGFGSFETPCAENMLTGEIFGYLSGSPMEPFFRGWRVCTTLENQLASSIPFCD